ncbi:MAG: formate dehydrogenase accessory sulfurtransferase FdhD [Candidatus Sumerlaeia bacterium]|nr:formate dehydrogenase accessory sulfurtransferase FdhD [Candidatus Sumerlaeia bacterium]
MHVWKKGKRFEGGAVETVGDALTVEAPLEIAVNGNPFTVTMRTPGDDRALARGILHTEGLVVDPRAPMILTEVAAEGSTPATVRVEIASELLTREFAGERSVLATSSCGLCGKREFETASTGDCPIRLHHRGTFDPSVVTGYLDALRRAQETFEVTGGSHAAAIFSPEHQMIAFAEDIGRHNAVDKAIGQLILDGRLADGEALLVSGRISYEIVYKGWRAGIPVLLAVSAPSSLAVSTAERLGMTLAAYCRGNRLTVYTEPTNEGQREA